jgi:hypothetical protein
VDIFVVLVNHGEPALIAAAEDDAAYVSGKKLAKWEIFIVYYFQFFCFVLMSFNPVVLFFETILQSFHGAGDSITTVLPVMGCVNSSLDACRYIRSAVALP